jgi:broad specificity phosphatase PhoE
MNSVELKKIYEDIMELAQPGSVISKELEEELKSAQAQAKIAKKAIHDAEQKNLREYFLGKTEGELRDELKTMISGDLYEFHNELEKTDEVAELLLLKFEGELLIRERDRLFGAALSIDDRGAGDPKGGQCLTVTILARDLGHDNLKIR